MIGWSKIPAILERGHLHPRARRINPVGGGGVAGERVGPPIQGGEGQGGRAGLRGRALAVREATAFDTQGRLEATTATAASGGSVLPQTSTAIGGEGAETAGTRPMWAQPAAVAISGWQDSVVTTHYHGVSPK